jgi:hypothetical protein
MAQLLFIISNYLAAYIAVSLPDISMQGEEPWRKALSGLACFPVVSLVCILCLGTIGILTPYNVVLWMTVVAATLYLVLKRRQKVDDDDLTSPNSPILINAAGKVEWWLAIAVFCVVLGVCISQISLKGIGYFWDDLLYHAPLPTHWLLDQKLSMSSFRFQKHYPLNAEAFALWFMLPFHSDALVNICGIFWVILSMAAIVVLCLACGAGRTTSLITASLFCVSPLILRMAQRFSAVDLAGPAMMLAAAALAIPEAKKKNTRWGNSLFMGLFCGFAVGSKYYFLPLPLVFLLWLVFGQEKNKNQRLKEAALFLVGVVVTGAYWNVRNLLVTGNPFYPAQVGFFPGPFGAKQQYQTALISWIMANPTDWDQWKFLIKGYLDWPSSSGILSVTGYGGALLAWLNRKRSNFPNRFPFFLLAIGSILLITYPGMPFSATINLPTGHLQVFLRYVIAPFVIGLILLAKFLDGKYRMLRILFFLLSGFSIVKYLNVYLDIRALIAAGLVMALGYIFFHTTRKRLVGNIFILTLLGGWVWWAPTNQQLNNEELYHFMLTEKGDPSMYNAWRFLETLPPGSKIETVGVAGWRYRYYPLFGRKFQFTPHMTGYRPTPEVWDHWFKESKPRQPAPPKKPKKKAKQRKKLKAKAMKYFQQLLADEVDYVIIIKSFSHNRWPKEKRWLKTIAQAQLVFGDRYSTIWKIL